MYKILYGLENAHLLARHGTFEELDRLVDQLLLDAARELPSGSEHTHKTYVIVMLNPQGGVVYTRVYTVRP